jgi:hypothetical protein
MDAFELLKADHKKVAELFDLLETASGKRKLDVFRRIQSELELHTHLEESIFYPALEKPEETHDLTLEAYEEHNVVKTLLVELSGAKSATDEWQAKAKVLRENVEHHVDEEENELFDKADDALSDEEIELLGERMAAEKARKQGRPVSGKSGAKDETKKSVAKPGIISKIANFVGFGNSTAKKASKKAHAKKKTAATKRATKSSQGSRTVGRKRASTKQGSKRASGSKASGGSKRKIGVSSEKAAKKRAGRK